MTVAELIEALKALPPDLRVGYSCDSGWLDVESLQVGTLQKDPGSFARWFEQGLRGTSEQVVELD